MNKQSNTYTIIYITVLVAIVGTLLAATYMSLKGRQQDNANADKMKQILASVHMTSDDATIKDDFSKYIVQQFVVNAAGEKISDNAFDVNVETQAAEKDLAKRQLPVYVCDLGDGALKYILPVYGAGLWGPIWGYVSVDQDGSHIYGAYFAHKSETPGLGAEIEKPAFSGQFDGKEMFRGDKYAPVQVVKKGQKPTEDCDYVDGVSGGTITSKGVSAMLQDCLKPYEAFLRTLKQ